MYSYLSIDRLVLEGESTQVNMTGIYQINTQNITGAWGTTLVLSDVRIVTAEQTFHAHHVIGVPSSPLFIQTAPNVSVVITHDFTCVQTLCGISVRGAAGLISIGRTILGGTALNPSVISVTASNGGGRISLGPIESPHPPNNIYFEADQSVDTRPPDQAIPMKLETTSGFVHPMDTIHTTGSVDWNNGVHELTPLNLELVATSGPVLFRYSGGDVKPETLTATSPSTHALDIRMSPNVNVSMKNLVVASAADTIWTVSGDGQIVVTDQFAGPATPNRMTFNAEAPFGQVKLVPNAPFDNAAGGMIIRFNGFGTGVLHVETGESNEDSFEFTTAVGSSITRFDWTVNNRNDPKLFIDVGVTVHATSVIFPSVMAWTGFYTQFNISGTFRTHAIEMSEWTQIDGAGVWECDGGSIAGDAGAPQTTPDGLRLRAYDCMLTTSQWHPNYPVGACLLFRRVFEVVRRADLVFVMMLCWWLVVGVGVGVGGWWLVVVEKLLVILSGSKRRRGRCRSSLLREKRSSDRPVCSVQRCYFLVLQN